MYVNLVDKDSFFFLQQALTVSGSRADDDSSQQNGVPLSESPEFSNGSATKDKQQSSDGKGGKRGGHVTSHVTKEREGKQRDHSEKIIEVMENGKADDKLSLSSTESDLVCGV